MTGERLHFVSAARVRRTWRNRRTQRTIRNPLAQVLWVGASLIDVGGTLWASDAAMARTHTRVQLIRWVAISFLVAVAGWLFAVSEGSVWRLIVGLAAFLVGAMTCFVGITTAIAWMRATTPPPTGDLWLDNVIRDPDGQPGAGAELTRWLVSHYTARGASIAWKAEHPDLVEYWQSRFPDAENHDVYFVVRLHTVASSDPDGPT